MALTLALPVIIGNLALCRYCYRCCKSYGAWISPLYPSLTVIPLGHPSLNGAYERPVKRMAIAFRRSLCSHGLPKSCTNCIPASLRWLFARA
jgi:hypothetical protein